LGQVGEFHLGEESELAAIHPQNGDPVGGAEPGAEQEGAVTADGDEQVGVTGVLADRCPGDGTGQPGAEAVGGGALAGGVNRAAAVGLARVEQESDGAAAGAHGGSPGRRRWTNHSWLPRAPRTAADTGPVPAAPVAASAQASNSRAPASAAAGSRTRPPRPTASRPSSNWGLKSATTSAPGTARAATGPRTSRSEMKDRSRVTSEGAGPGSRVRVRRLVRSRTVTRGS